MKYQQVVPFHFQVDNYFNFIVKNFPGVDTEQLDNFVLFIYSSNINNINAINKALVVYMVTVHAERFEQLVENHKTRWIDSMILCRALSDIASSKVSSWNEFIVGNGETHAKFKEFMTGFEALVEYKDSLKTKQEELRKVLKNCNANTRVEFRNDGLEIEDLLEPFYSFDDSELRFYVSKDLYQQKEKTGGKLFIVGKNAVAGEGLVRYHFENIEDEIPEDVDTDKAES